MFVGACDRLRHAQDPSPGSTRDNTGHQQQDRAVQVFGGEHDSTKGPQAAGVSWGWQPLLGGMPLAYRITNNIVPKLDGSCDPPDPDFMLIPFYA
jgi:hypothetical protein